MNVKARADAVGTFRFVSVFWMETLARWIPLTPEMEVKMLFGRHVWRMAQQADRMGKRARELRAPLHYSNPPRDGYLAALQKLAAVTDTLDRLEAFHDIGLPALETAYRRYLEQTDPLIDEPTVILCNQALGEIQMMRQERAEWGDEIPVPPPGGAERLAGLRQTFASEHLN